MKSDNNARSCQYYMSALALFVIVPYLVNRALQTVLKMPC